MEIKKSKVWQTALYTAAIDIFIIAITAFVNRKDQYGVLGVAIVMGVLFFLQFLGGLIVAMPIKSRQTGQGILLGTLLMLLGGLGVCSLMAF